jgi:hypothetical protein
MIQRRLLKRPPVAIHRARLENLAIVPGSLLGRKKQWQAIANRLPGRAVLIVLPATNAWQRKTMLAVAKLLGEAGHQVRVISETEVSHSKVRPRRV